MITHIQPLFQPLGVRGGQCDDPSYHANRELCYGSSAREHRGGPASFRPPPRASPSASVSAWKYDGCSQAALNGGESSSVTTTAATHVSRMALLGRCGSLSYPPVRLKSSSNQQLSPPHSPLLTASTTVASLHIPCTARIITADLGTARARPSRGVQRHPWISRSRRWLRHERRHPHNRA